MPKLVEVDDIPSAKLVEVEPTTAVDTPRQQIERMSRDRRASVLSALNGLTFGFGDEIAGAIGGDGIKQKMREELSAYQERNPTGAITSSIVGGLPLGGVIGKGLSSVVPAAKSLAGQLAIGSGVGGVTGAISGYGENTDPDRLGGDIGVSAAMGAFLPLGLSAAAGGIRQGMARFSPEGAKQWAQEKIAQAFSRDGITGQQAARRMEALGPEARAVDGGRDSTRALLDTLAITPGQTKANVTSAIAERQGTRGTRMREAAEDAFGVNGFRLAPEMETWIAQREAAAGPLYEKVTKMTVRPDATLMSIISAADELGATKLGQSIATARRQPWSLDPANGQPMSMRDLDNLKKGLDQMVSKETKPDGKMTPLGASFNELRQSLIKKLDTMTMGQYQRARDAFAGPSAIMDAASAGQRALLQDDASIKSLMAGLSGSEKDAFALGAFEALRAKLGTQAGQTEMMKLWRQDGLKEKLQAIFGDQKAYLEFARKMYGEKTMAGLERVGVGSQTEPRRQASRDLDNPVAALLGGNPTTPTNIMRGLGTRLGTPEAVRDQMGTFLLTRDPNQVRALDPLIQSINQGRTQQQMQMGILSGLL